MTWSQLCAALADDPTERGLRDVVPARDQFWLADPLDADDTVGHVIVQLDDGLYGIPYTAVWPDDGWEQLDLAHAWPVPALPALPAALRVYARATATVVRLLGDARWQALDAQRVRDARIVS
ncbi:hypothetical protein [Sulfobacillus sp. hq2]|uniref:hypothetical protein n=1 Tax=Sulfobacillus sp. hq2 TaxID=2039167 RepID=UPI000CCFFE09|nr:hypothetical protein [Sulfobacillus sp. hq2]POB12211.1 hypothetical protein CO251_00865 [Sulfobacillus sp. hq2]